jgi:3-hydroxyisobutyrate dehydrogenase-like beta-hydroxyacid dehydrogenase
VQALESPLSNRLKSLKKDKNFNYMATNIGFIGLGNLGTPISTNLVSSGRPLLVFNRTPSKMAALAEKGAIVCDTIASLASKCQVVFSIVSDDAALESVVNGGLLAHLQPDGIHVSMSTILPDTAKKLFDLHQGKGQHYLAAPVFGRPEAAAARKLNFAVSGKQNVRKQIEPLLKDAGAIAVWDFGDDISAANTVKLCGNFLIASALEAIGESITLAENSGVDAKKMWNMLSQTLFSAPVYQIYSNIILQKKFENAGFTVKLGLKDINLVLKQAESVAQYLPLAKLLQTNMQELVHSGKPDIDWSAVSLGAKR